MKQSNSMNNSSQKGSVFSTLYNFTFGRLFTTNIIETGVWYFIFAVFSGVLTTTMSALIRVDFGLLWSDILHSNFLSFIAGDFSFQLLGVFSAGIFFFILFYKFFLDRYIKNPYVITGMCLSIYYCCEKVYLYSIRYQLSHCHFNPLTLSITISDNSDTVFTVFMASVISVVLSRIILHCKPFKQAQIDISSKSLEQENTSVKSKLKEENFSGEKKEDISGKANQQEPAHVVSGSEAPQQPEQVSKPSTEIELPQEKIYPAPASVIQKLSEGLQVQKESMKAYNKPLIEFAKSANENEEEVDISPKDTALAVSKTFPDFGLSLLKQIDGGEISGKKLTKSEIDFRQNMVMDYFFSEENINKMLTEVGKKRMEEAVKKSSADSDTGFDS